MTRDDSRFARLRKLAEKLPETEVVPVPGVKHVGFKVRKKTFAWYLFDHHGDGIVGLACKSTRAQQHDRVEAAPDRYFVPAYLGASGWVGLRLDRATVNWDEVSDLLTEAWRLQAPKRLASLLD